MGPIQNKMEDTTWLILMRTDWYWGVCRARAVDTGPAAVTPPIITTTNQLVGVVEDGKNIYVGIIGQQILDFRYVCDSVDIQHLILAE